jgi:glycosyltransferase involved in cell wall biosynthesis
LAVTKSPTAVICLSPYAGGMEIDSIKMAEKLAPHCQALLIAKADHFIAKEYANKERAFDLETINFSSNLSFSIIFGVRKLVKRYGIKNVIFFGASELKSLYFSFLGMDINLIIRHGTTKSTPKKDWFHRLIYSKVNYHVAICQHLANNVKKIIPFGKSTKLKVIYPSLNLYPDTTIDFSEKPHIPLQILHVGRIAPGKGQITAIKACKILHEHNIDFHLTFVGGFHDDYQKSFNNFLSSIPYKDKITLAGHQNDLESFYLQSDIFLFPSDGEGLSNAFIEALAFGLACIAYDNTSFPELLDLGFTFDMVQNGSVESLSHTLLEKSSNKNYTSFRHNSTLALEKFTSKEVQETLACLV